MKREIKQENIYRVLRVCYSKLDLEHFKSEYMQVLRQKKTKFEEKNNIIAYKTDRSHLIKIMFLTPNESHKIKGSKYNEVQDLGKASTHPLYIQFLKEIEPYKIAKLFNA